MIDWGARVEVLMDALRRHHGVNDRVAIEVMLAAMVNCPRTPSTWLTLETNWYSRDCLGAWFSFGQSWIPQSWPRLRARYPWRAVEAEMQEWVDNLGDEHLFIEPDYDRYPNYSRLSQGQSILQRTLRLRLRTHRAADPLRSLDRQIEERIADEINAATRFVIEDHVRSRPENPPRFVDPPNFLYSVELVQRLAPWYRDWHILLQQFGALAVRRAHLYGRSETNQEDCAVIARVAADSIPVWIAQAMRLLHDGPAAPHHVEKVMMLEEARRRTEHGAHRELVRLRRAGMIEYSREKRMWRLAEQHRHGIAELLDGRAFGLLASVA